QIAPRRAACYLDREPRQSWASADPRLINSSAQIPHRMYELLRRRMRVTAITERTGVLRTSEGWLILTWSAERTRHSIFFANSGERRMGRYKDYHREPKGGRGYNDDHIFDDRTSGVRSNFSRPSAAAARRPAAASQVVGSTNESIGTVKMYKADKGFG